MFFLFCPWQVYVFVTVLHDFEGTVLLEIANEVMALECQRFQKICSLMSTCLGNSIVSTTLLTHLKPL